MGAETIYLFFVLCFNAECTTGSAYVVDQFHGVAAVTDCDDRADALAVSHQGDTRAWRIGCRTLAQFNAEGV